MSENNGEGERERGREIVCERKGFEKERVRVFAPVSKIKRNMFTRE